jgi:DNA-binding helix-hairpin-helix protein with protein kinase domain
MVAKVFTHPSTERAEKLRAMIDNPPVVAGNVPVVLAWPLDRLLTPNGECVGYVMPYAKDMEPLFTIFHPGTRPRWADYRCLLRTAKNLALAVSALHRHGYVVGDINESNVLVGPDASVAVVDTDSIQVRTTRGVLRCQVGKPEFTAPEIARTGMSFDQIDRYPHHDAFGLGVLIFQLLMDGNHPFAARYVGTAGRQTQTERIAHGDWPYSTRRNGDYQPRRDAPPLESLSPEIQRLMRDCFEAGHANPVCRPTADAWHHALAKAEQEWNEIGPQLRHFYYRVLNRRAWGQRFLGALAWVRPAVARVPRKAWAATCCVVVIALLVLAFLCWPRSTEPSPGRPGERTTTQQSEPEVGGEETPWMWREAQRQNRMKQ